MHAAFPCLSADLQQVLRLGAQRGEATGELPAVLERAGGTLLAAGMAALLKLGFGFIMRDSLIDRDQTARARAFFEDNFVIDDPQAEGGRRYYQGRFLIRTRRPGDDMNVLLRFCPHPEKLYEDTPFGKSLNPLEVVSTQLLDEQEADAIEREAGRVDMVVRFKDARSILGLLRRGEFDIVSLLLENLVQLTGNTAHLFKLGAIGTDIELLLGQHKSS